jgi:hypothetical protein
MLAAMGWQGGVFDPKLRHLKLHVHRHVDARESYGRSGAVCDRDESGAKDEVGAYGEYKSTTEGTENTEKPGWERHGRIDDRGTR